MVSVSSSLHSIHFVDSSHETWKLMQTFSLTPFADFYSTVRARIAGDSVQFRNLNIACSRFFQDVKARLTSVVKLPKESF